MINEAVNVDVPFREDERASSAPLKAIRDRFAFRDSEGEPSELENARAEPTKGSRDHLSHCEKPRSARVGRRPAEDSSSPTGRAGFLTAPTWEWTDQGLPGASRLDLRREASQGA